MTIIDVLAAFEEGAYPTNEQILALLQYMQHSSLLSSEVSAAKVAAAPKGPKASPVLDRRHLSPETRDMLDEFSELLSAIGRLVQERNPHEEIQEALWRSRGAAKAALQGVMQVKQDKGKKAIQGLVASAKENREAEKAEKAARKAARKASKDSLLSRAKSAKNSTKQASVHMRTLLRLVLIQPTLRHVLSDMFFYLEATMEETVGTLFDTAQTDLGQANSAQGRAAGDVSVLQAGIESGAAAALGGARLVKQEFQERRANVQNTARIDGATRQADGSVQIGEIAPDLAAQEQAKAQTSKLDKAAEQLAVAQQLIVSAAEQTKDEHGRLPESVAGLAAAVDAQGKDLANGHAAGSGVPNGSTPTDILDAAQMAAVSNMRVGNISLAKQGELPKLAKTGAVEFAKNSKENWTPERKERLFIRFRKLFADLQRQPDYRESILFFIEMIEKAVPLPAEAAAAKTKESRTQLIQRKLQAALGETSEPLIDFLDNFADGSSLRTVLQDASELAADTIDDGDPKNASGVTVQSFWRLLDKYIRDLLLQEGYALSPKAETDAKAIRKAYQDLSKEYKQKVLLVVKEVSRFVHAFRKDAILGEIMGHAKQFLKRLAVSKEGGGLPSKAIWNDLRRVILPFLFDTVGVLPIPRVRYLHPDFDITVENVALQLKQLLPDTFDLKLNNDFHVDFRQLKESSHAHQIKFKIKGMGIRVHKLAYAFRWKKGISFLDKGIGDLNIDGFGLSMYIDIPKHTTDHFFIVKKVKAKLSTLSLKVQQSNHRLLHAFANQLVNSFLTKRILRSFIAYGVTLGLRELDLALLRIRLNENVEQDRITLEEIKAQMAAIRDLLRKYHEQAGEIQIDFTRENDPEDQRSWDDFAAFRFVKSQISQTARREIVRDEWRSNAFDLPGTNTIKPRLKETLPKVPPQKTSSRAEETAAEAQAHGKPMITTQKVVATAAEDVQQRHLRESAAPVMESQAGRAAVAQTDDAKDQRKFIEKSIK